MAKKDTEAKLPADEKIVVTYTRDGVPVMYITVKKSSPGLYYLIKFEDGKLKRIDKSNNPIVFDKIYAAGCKTVKS